MTQVPAPAPVPPPSKPASSNEGWMTRENALAWALVVVTGIVFYLCYYLILPFLPSVAWALALAVIAHPLHRRLKQWVTNSNVAAGLSVALVALMIVGPVIFVSNSLIREAGNAAQIIQEKLASGEWRKRLEESPRLKPMVTWLESRMNGEKERTQKTAPQTDAVGRPAPPDSTASKNSSTAASRAAGESDPQNAEKESENPTGETDESERRVGEPAEKSMPWERALAMLSQGLGAAVSGTVWLGMQLFITMMCLYFFLRDRHHALDVVRSLMPLSRVESDEVFTRVDDTIHATIFGSLMVALVQGFMGGLIFWWLELPSPLFWGAVMGLLAVVPVLGTFVIWAPTAAYLALQGDWGKAAVLASWGGIAIGLIDNFLYPFLVGKRLQFHTLLVFFAIVGGLAQFGASGIILGPVLLAIADALLDIWKRRTAYGGTIEEGVECSTT